MTKYWALPLLFAILAPGCRETRRIDVDTSQEQDIPRELAIEKLSEVLPTAYHFGMTDPDLRWRTNRIEDWIVDGKGFEVHPVDVEGYRLPFSSIISTRLEERGKYSTITLVTQEATETEAEAHTYFRWRKNPDGARKALELFEALRRNQ